MDNMSAASRSSNNGGAAAVGGVDGDRRPSDDSASISSFKISTAGGRSVADEANQIDPRSQMPKDPGELYVQKGRPKLQLSESYKNPDMYGYLYKYAGVSFQRRFFILRGTILLYYVSHNHTEPKGCFLLDEARLHKGAKICERGNLINKMFANLNLATPYSVVITRPSGAAVELCASNEYQLDEWVKAFVATGAVERFSDIPIQPPANAAAIRPGAAGQGAIGPAHDSAMQPDNENGAPSQQNSQTDSARPPIPEGGAAQFSPRSNGTGDPRFPQGGRTGAPPYPNQTSRSNHTQSSSGNSVTSFKGVPAGGNPVGGGHQTYSLEHIPSQEDAYYDEEEEDADGGMPSSNSQT